MSGSIAGAIEIPMGSTDRNWNIRIILEDEIGAITNLGPNLSGQQNFQNYNYLLIIFSYQQTTKDYQPNIHFIKTTQIHLTLRLRLSIIYLIDALVNIDIYDLKGFCI